MWKIDMIRKFSIKDLDRVMEIWLSGNVQAHPFIPKEYWAQNFNGVRLIFPMADVYVYEDENGVQGFIGVDQGYIAGIFVFESEQSKGIGSKLIDKVKSIYDSLRLNVYEKNRRAISFYLREGFIVKEELIDENTGMVEFSMIWKK